MPAKRGIGGNRIDVKLLCVYALLCALCICMGFLESLLPLNFIAPGIKLGLSNGIALLLVLNRDIKGAFAVNISRILLSNLLFSSPLSLLFALSGGISSLIVSSLMAKSRHFSGIGISIVGAFIHNIVQIAVAQHVLEYNVIYYLPFLLLASLISGALIGFLSEIIFKKLKTNR